MQRLAAVLCGGNKKGALPSTAGSLEPLGGHSVRRRPLMLAGWYIKTSYLYVAENFLLGVDFCKVLNLNKINILLEFDTVARSRIVLPATTVPAGIAFLCRQSVGVLVNFISKSHE